MLEIKNIHSGYYKKEVLHNVSFKAKPFNITAIIGPNGCGKSTLLKSISNIIPINSGEILLKGNNLLDLPQNKIAQKVAYLSQNKQIPDISVKRLVLHGRFPYLNYPRRYRKIDYEIVEKVLKQMNIYDLKDIPLSNLSGGQQQKAYIAMALAQDTDIILLDEPTTFLDISYQLQVLKQMKELAKLGKFIIMVVHDISSALENSDSIVLMKEGKILKQGTPKEIYESKLLEETFDIKVERIQINNEYRYFISN